MTSLPCKVRLATALQKKAAVPSRSSGGIGEGGTMTDITHASRGVKRVLCYQAESLLTNGRQDLYRDIAQSSVVADNSFSVRTADCSADKNILRPVIIAIISIFQCVSAEESLILPKPMKKPSPDRRTPVSDIYRMRRAGRLLPECRVCCKREPRTGSV